MELSSILASAIAGGVLSTYTASRILKTNTRHDSSNWYASFVTPQSHILHIGCSDSALFEALNVISGYGVYYGAKPPKPSLNKSITLVSTLHEIHHETRFDYIFISGIPSNTVIDTFELLDQVKQLSHARTRIVIEQRSWSWNILHSMRALVRPCATAQNEWISERNLASILTMKQMTPVTSGYYGFLPCTMPVLSSFINRLFQLPGLRYLCHTQYTVCYAPQITSNTLPSVSVIIPCKNEAGTIESIVTRIPSLGSHTELVFVEGGSKDNTAATIREMIIQYRKKDIKLYHQAGKGKYDAVKEGCAKATGDIIIIFDGDFSVPPHTLPLFVNALSSHHAECVNGSRLVFHQERGAMFFTAYCANRFFACALSWITGQPLTDTLCGTKVFWKSDYMQYITTQTGWYDPFGDFDILLRSAQRWLKITNIPIAYKNRTYGATNISHYKEVWYLLKIVLDAALIFKK